jgi:hypothetical protein
VDTVAGSPARSRSSTWTALRPRPCFRTPDRRSRSSGGGAWGAAKPSVEIVYAVTSLDHRSGGPQLIAEWLQGHWAIENRVHHVRDVTQREDASRIRAGTGPQSMAALRNTATTIARLGGHSNIAAAQRTAAWSPTAITDALYTA